MVDTMAKDRDNRLKHGAYSKILKADGLAALDQRTAFGKAVAALRRSLITDLGGDPSVQQSFLIDRVIAKALQASALEAKLLEGHEASRAFYISLSNSLRHDLLALGLERKAKDMGKTLKELLDEDAD